MQKQTPFSIHRGEKASKRWLLLTATLFLMLACTLGQASPTPHTGNQAQIQTAVAQTVNAQQASHASASISTPSPTRAASTQTPAPTQTPSWTPTVAHQVSPAAVPRADTWLYDTISGKNPPQHGVYFPPNGDVYRYNLYERPFNAQTQDTYFPELDIRQADIGHDETWVYVSLNLYGLPSDPANWDTTAYGVELDLNINGRGDWLIWAEGPFQESWSTDGVHVYHDTDNDIGEVRACRDDPPQDGTSYDELVFNSGQGDDPDVAWVRLLPSGGKNGAPRVDLAFKYDLIQRDEAFMWWVWADRGVNRPLWMDYHDHFTFEEAGEPFPQGKRFPIKAIAEVDNTCHWVFGFEPTGNEPCACAFATPTPQLSGASGHFYKSSHGVSGIGVQVLQGSCSGPVVASTSSGSGGGYNFTLPPGTYCIKPHSTLSWNPSAYHITLRPGEFKSGLDFRLSSSP